MIKLLIIFQRKQWQSQDLNSQFDSKSHASKHCTHKEIDSVEAKGKYLEKCFIKKSQEIKQ